MNLWLSFQHWHRGVRNWGPTHLNFIYGYKHTYLEQRWVDGGRCSTRMDCAMGTRSSGLVVLWLVIQKQSDGALERGFGCTWRSFGCRATESDVCTVTSRISGYSFQQRNRYTNTARLYYALGRAVPVFSAALIATLCVPGAFVFIYCIQKSCSKLQHSFSSG